jgi:restriction system protein
MDQLIGAMQNFRAEQCLLVSWGGFKSSIDKETASQFFTVRLWDADAVVDQLLEQYEKLPADLRAEIPLKRIWTISAPENGE